MKQRIATSQLMELTPSQQEKLMVQTEKCPKCPLVTLKGSLNTYLYTSLSCQYTFEDFCPRSHRFDDDDFDDREFDDDLDDYFDDSEEDE